MVLVERRRRIPALSSEPTQAFFHAWSRLLTLAERVSLNELPEIQEESKEVVVSALRPSVNWGRYSWVSSLVGGSPSKGDLANLLDTQGHTLTLLQVEQLARDTDKRLATGMAKGKAYSCFFIKMAGNRVGKAFVKHDEDALPVPRWHVEEIVPFGTDSDYYDTRWSTCLVPNVPHPL